MAWYNSYKWWWSRLGSRPWTNISRDIYHQVEYVVLVGLVTVGYLAGKADISWRWFLVVMAVYTLGYIHGHFFWGTKYIKNQEGK